MHITHMLIWTLPQHFVDRVDTLWRGIQQWSIDLVLALAVVLVGWVLSVALSRLTLVLLRAARFNIGVRSVLARGGETLALEPSAFASWAVYWAGILITLTLACDTLGFDLSGPVAERLREVLPRVVVAAVLLVSGVLLAMLLGGITRRLFDSGGLSGARLRGQVVTVVLSGCAVLLALEQLGFAAQFVMAVGVCAVAALALGAGLAFGLGCRELARDFVVEYLRSMDRDASPRPPS